MSGANPRRGRVLLGLWLSKAEIRSMKESLKMFNDSLKRNFAVVNIVEIMEKANERGDFNKK